MSASTTPNSAVASVSHSTLVPEHEPPTAIPAASPRPSNGSSVLQSDEHPTEEPETPPVIVPVKRGPGRPKGSVSKKRRQDDPKRPLRRQGKSGEALSKPSEPGPSQQPLPPPHLAHPGTHPGPTHWAPPPPMGYHTPYGQPYGPQVPAMAPRGPFPWPPQQIYSGYPPSNPLAHPYFPPAPPRHSAPPPSTPVATSAPRTNASVTPAEAPQETARPATVPTPAIPSPVTNPPINATPANSLSTLPSEKTPANAALSPPEPVPPAPAPAPAPAPSRQRRKSAAKRPSMADNPIDADALQTVVEQLSERALPPGVRDAFKAHTTEILRRNSSGLPDVYAVLKTFWLPQTPNYFILTSAKASHLSSHKFFYWDPLYLLVGGMQCPACSEGNLVRPPGKPFAGPFEVLDVPTPWYLIGAEYICPNENCAKFWKSWDNEIVSSLPSELEKEFPAHFVSNTSALSGALYKVMQGCIGAGLEQSEFLGVLQRMSKRRAGDENASEREEQEGTVPDEARMRPTGIVNAFYDAWRANAIHEHIPGKPPPSGPAASSGQHQPPAQTTVNSAPTNRDDTPEPDANNPPDPNSENGTPSTQFTTQYSSRRPRHCRKCGSAECNGKRSHTYCENACQDCGKKECRGRAGRPPNRTCQDD